MDKKMLGNIDIKFVKGVMENKRGGEDIALFSNLWI